MLLVVVVLSKKYPLSLNFQQKKYKSSISFFFGSFNVGKNLIFYLELIFLVHSVWIMLSSYSLLPSVEFRCFYLPLLWVSIFRFKTIWQFSLAYEVFCCFLCYTNWMSEHASGWRCSFYVTTIFCISFLVKRACFNFLLFQTRNSMLSHRSLVVY